MASRAEPLKAFLLPALAFESPWPFVVQRLLASSPQLPAGLGAWGPVTELGQDCSRNAAETQPRRSRDATERQELPAPQERPGFQKRLLVQQWH